MGANLKLKMEVTNELESKAFEGKKPRGGHEERNEKAGKEMQFCN